jgi:hypothetical protein
MLQPFVPHALSCVKQVDTIRKKPNTLQTPVIFKTERKSKAEVTLKHTHTHTHTHISLRIVVITDFANVDFQVYVLLQCAKCVYEFKKRCKQDLNTQQTRFENEFQNTSYLLLLAFIYKKRKLELNFEQDGPSLKIL